MIELHLNIFQNVVENPASSIPIPRKTGWSELFCEHHKWEKKKTPQKTTIAKNQNTMKRIPLPTVAAATTTTNANKNSKTKKRRTTRNCIKCVPIVNPDQKHPKDMAH
jgi:hypothetical protein